jgi:hypothetical protein
MHGSYLKDNKAKLVERRQADVRRVRFLAASSRSRALWSSEGIYGWKSTFTAARPRHIIADIGGIVLHNLLSFGSRDPMARDVAYIRVIPLEFKTRLGHSDFSAATRAFVTLIN